MTDEADPQRGRELLRAHFGFFAGWDCQQQILIIDTGFIERW